MDSDLLIRSMQGYDTVFHVAAKAGVWGAYDGFYAANVTGTRNVIDACRHNGIRHLVYTSSPSVTFDGSHQQGIDESVPYPDRWLCHYPHTMSTFKFMISGDNLFHLYAVPLNAFSLTV